MCFIAATWATIVCAPRVSVSWSAPSSLAASLRSQPLGRELDRRQRILDLVREPARDLAPRRVALRLREIGDVVEHHDVAGHRASPAAASRASAACASGWPPRARPASASARRGSRESLPRRARRTAPAPGSLRAPVGERHAGQLGQRLLQDHRGARVGRAQPIARRRTRARRPTGCRGCSRGRRAWSRSRAATSSVFCCASASCAVIVLNDSVSTPSSSREVTGWRRVKSPCATARVPSASSPSGADEALGQHEGEPQRGGEREQQRQRQRQRVEALQRLPRERDLLVVARSRPAPSRHPAASAFGTGSMTCSSLQRLEPVVAVDRHDDAQHAAARPPPARCAAYVCCSRARRSACAGGGSGGAVEPPMPATASTLPVDENSAAS